MSFKIAIASGKGGTGKTTVSVNLFEQFSEHSEGKIQLVDCDVEEPNDHIFFNRTKKISEEEVFQQVPTIDKDKCTFCRKCSEYCEFNAIVVIPPVRFAEVNQSLCHSCGACSVACEFDAITEHPESIGKVSFYKTGNNKGLVEGKLKIGSAMQTMLIKELKKRVPLNAEIVLYDSPPGTSCPVVETISNTDYVILVAEPTLFGLYDLKLMVNLVRELAIPFGIIINKSGLGSNDIYEYLYKESIDILGEIPFNKEYAGVYAKGQIVGNMPVEMKNVYKSITEKLHKMGC
ncbi:MAG: ATP-binding protein [Bacteroidales bacterium]|nr:ATP-binding protein [Bacteroidales bacterium]MBN2819940.1 ATP-binding protein [Bacteroidales bacterium]